MLIRRFDGAERTLSLTCRARGAPETLRLQAELEHSMDGRLEALMH